MTQCTKVKTFVDDGNCIYPELQICAGGEEGKDSCAGDSGSGLMRAVKSSQNNTAVFYLVGVVSWGLTYCGGRNVPAIYAKVSKYLPWILDSLSKLI